jgi:hypothetical protein
MEHPDYIELIQGSSRDKFIASCPFPFLVGGDVLAKPRGPQPTVHGKEYPEIQRFLASGKPPPMTKTERPIVLGVRKVQKAFPSMITVGRTSNNDVVLSDVQISKFHAFFRQQDGGRFELLDAGSRNGTWVGENKVPSKGDAHPVRVGDELQFGQLRFSFFDAARCWDTVRGLLGG